MATRKKSTRKSSRKKSSPQSARKRKAGSARPARRKPPKGSKGGKPKVEFDLKDLRELAATGNTNRTIARLLHVSEATLQARIADTPEVSDAIDLGKAELERDLRTAQVKYAKKGHGTMLVWLGKQVLGQRDVRAVELTGQDGAPMELQAELRPVLEQKLVEFLRNRRH